MPLFLYQLEEIVHEVRPCAHQDLVVFMKRRTSGEQLAPDPDQEELDRRLAELEKDDS